MIFADIAERLLSERQVRKGGRGCCRLFVGRGRRFAGWLAFAFACTFAFSVSYFPFISFIAAIAISIAIAAIAAIAVRLVFGFSPRFLQILL